MALKCNLSEFNVATMDQLEAVHERILASFIRAGENFVTQAREQIQDHNLGTYKDQTTNLRNSIGYMIFFKGEKIHDNIGPMANDLAAMLDRVDPSGYQLIGFAGMNYASFVEAKGYNVISTQADTCIMNLTGFLEVLNVVEKDEVDIESFGTQEYDPGL